MKRRAFVQASALPVLLPTELLASQTGADSASRSLTLFDSRFTTAQLMARQLSASAGPLPVRGDITPLWNRQLKKASRLESLHLQGVTTESVYFCLQRLLQPQCRLQVQSTRLDQDLVAWSITTTLR